MLEDKPEEWISSGDALGLIIARTGSEEVAHDVLNKRLREGAFKVRANAYVVADQASAARLEAFALSSDDISRHLL